MSGGKDYYDGYWRANGQASPMTDPLTGQRVRRFLEVTNGAQRVLDLGCGHGGVARLLVSKTSWVIGMDISDRPLLEARKSCPSADFLQGACDAPLPFAQDSFDAVYCAEVIEHLLHPAAMIAECHRVLRRSGTLFITTPYHGLIKNIAIALKGFEKHFDATGPHIRFFTRRSLSALLRENGFVVQRTWYLGRFWPVWMNMAVSAVKI